MIAVAARIAPNAAPAMVPLETPDEVDVCVGDGATLVDDGTAVMVEDGEAELRQLVISERETNSVSEDPPELPWASVIEKTIVVPAATSAGHV